MRLKSKENINRMAKITVKDTSVTIISVNENDYISLTDIARYQSDDPTAVIGNWLRNRNTIEYFGIWESLYNPNFNPLEFEGVKKEAGLNAFTLSPTKWISTTNAIGILSKSGRYGGTYAHKDIAFKFASWISVENQLLHTYRCNQAKPYPSRDYATINELICLSNMESLNAVFIEQGIPQGERLVKLNQIAIHQMEVLKSGSNERKLLK